ncbi:hypothetical protein BT63DRAFT_427913 [Microthyrium microscopicum]|uniref:Uncharacterized protein n=1 Tax=Microthyrium microscopicum TaxID=703497 RepID=A0A6A6U3V9_9PEZI|nr:hypothetical protein BT63DRAFT_427913 [Microthyrium microscopicum]
MGAVVSCIESIFRAIGNVILAIVHAIGAIIFAIVDGIMALFDIIIGCLTCRKGSSNHGWGARRSRRRGGGITTSRV